MLASNTERRGTTTPWSSATTTRHLQQNTADRQSSSARGKQSSVPSFFVLEQKRFVLSLSRLLFVRVRAKRIYLYIYKEVCVLRGIGFRRFQCLRDFPERLVHGLVSLIPESDPVGRFPVFDRHRERHRLSDDVRLIRKASGDLDHEIR